MRAGLMDREIVIDSYGITRDEYNNPVEGWSRVGAYRAQRIEASTEQFIANAGIRDKIVSIFRIWYVPGITVGSRVVADGIAHEIVEVKEIGRRVGLDIRTISDGSPVD